MDGLVTKWLEQWSEQMSWIWYMIPGECEVYFHGLIPVSAFLDPVKNSDCWKSGVYYILITQHK